MQNYSEHYHSERNNNHVTTNGTHQHNYEFCNILSPYLSFNLVSPFHTELVWRQEVLSLNNSENYYINLKAH